MSSSLKCISEVSDEDSESEEGTVRNTLLQDSMLQDKSDARTNIENSISMLGPYAESNILLDAKNKEEKIELRPPPNNYYIESSQRIPMVEDENTHRRQDIE